MSNGVIIGIDPGLDGAIATRYPDGSWLVSDMPTIGKGRDRTILLSDLVADLDLGPDYEIDASMVFVEKVHSMPKQGVASSFKFGWGCGALEGVLTALGYPYQLVTPQRWKKAMLDGTKRDKPAAIVVAMQLLPSAARHLTRAKDHNRADAMLIAEYGRRQIARGVA